ncbi:hypothetical protein [Pontibacter kalidii]|nr:hypothetical protein [Pontibacter kalidii]
MKEAAAVEVWLKYEQSMKGTSGRLRQGGYRNSKYKSTSIKV